MPLLFEQFISDPKLKKCKDELLAVLQGYQGRITGVRGADAALKHSYDALIARFSENRGGALWYPYLASGMGNGALVELADGSVKYDFISGIGVHFGHAHPAVVRAALDAAFQDTVMQGNLQQNARSAEFTELMVKSSALPHCFLSSSGAMACENALKMIFQKKYPAQRILAFEHCFMGRTVMLSNITDKAGYREGLPQNFQVDYVPFFDAEKPAESTEKAVSALKNHLSRHGGRYAAMCFELVQGEGGYHAGETQFFRRLMEILKKENVAILIDEIQTLGRTPSLFAFQHFGLGEFADVVTFGKLTQVCGTLFRDEFKPKAGLISQTFTASTSAIECGLAILKALVGDNFLGPTGKIAAISNQLSAHLNRLAKTYPGIVRGPFGLGCMAAATVFDGEAEKVKTFLNRLFENGVVAFSCGSSPTRVRLLAPIGSVRAQDVDSAMEIFEKTIRECGDV